MELNYQEMKAWYDLMYKIPRINDHTCKEIKALADKIYDHDDMSYKLDSEEKAILIDVVGTISIMINFDGLQITAYQRLALLNIQSEKNLWDGVVVEEMV